MEIPTQPIEKGVELFNASKTPPIKHLKETYTTVCNALLAYWPKGAKRIVKHTLPFFFGPPRVVMMF